MGIAIKTQNKCRPYDTVMPIDNTDYHGDKTHHAMVQACHVELAALGGPITSGTATTVTAGQADATVI